MYWTLELASKLEDAPWPATKDELIDYAMRSGAPMEVIENLQEMEEKICKKWRTRVRYTKASKIFGPIIPARKTSSSTRKNINAFLSVE